MNKKAIFYKKINSQRGITLISLIITIVILIIIASIFISISLKENGIFIKAREAKEETNKQTATEKINLKITTVQIHTYGEKQEMPTLQEVADFLCEDEEIEYVKLESKSKVASLNKIVVGNKTSIFTKLKEYPYEFEINSNLQLASIDKEDVIIGKNEMKFINNKNGFTDIAGETICNSYGISCKNFGTETDDEGFYYTKAEKKLEVNLDSKFEISTQMYFNNETTSFMGGIEVNLYKDDDKLTLIYLNDNWEKYNRVNYTFCLGEDILYNENYETINASGRFGMVSDGNKLYCYWGNQLLTQVDYNEGLNCDKVEIKFRQYPGHESPNIYIESLYVGEPLYYATMI